MLPASSPGVSVAAAALAAAALSAAASDGTESAAATPRFHQQQRDGDVGPSLVVFSGGTAFNSVAGRLLEKNLPCLFTILE
jgi:hypothetical protein